MKKQLDLFGKTFNQQVLATDGRVEAHDISPNRRIPAEIVFESIGARIMVTAYDSEDRVLFRGEDGKAEKDAPTRKIQGEVIFEPLGAGIRVTARDENHQVLWGFVGAKETIDNFHCLVAVYDTLQNLLSLELEKRGLLVPESTDPIEKARQAIASLKETTQWLEDGLDVKKESDATRERARAIARIAGDANRQITLEAKALRGMKPRTTTND